jgi:hypothetical protein
MKKAKLLELKRGFGGDSYIYEITGHHKDSAYEGNEHLLVTVGWGLLAPSITIVQTMETDSVNVRWTVKGGDAVSARDALERLGWAVEEEKTEN